MTPATFFLWGRKVLVLSRNSADKRPSRIFPSFRRLIAFGLWPQIKYNTHCYRCERGGEAGAFGDRQRNITLRKMLVILYCGTKIEANSWNSVPNHSVDEKMLGIQYHGTKKEANSRNSVHPSKEKTTRNFVPWNKNTEKQILGIPFQSN
jgi:hypothetical protein